MDILYDRIPKHCQGGLRRYVEDGVPPGSFLQMVLENKLVEAIGWADDINSERLRDYALWLYNDAPRYPIPCWGSREIVAEWIKLGGLHGLQRKRGETIAGDEFVEQE